MAEIGKEGVLTLSDSINSEIPEFTMLSEKSAKRLTIFLESGWANYICNVCFKYISPTTVSQAAIEHGKKLPYLGEVWKQPLN